MSVLAAVGDSLPALARYALVAVFPAVGFAGCLYALVRQGHEADRARAQARNPAGGWDWDADRDDGLDGVWSR